MSRRHITVSGWAGALLSALVISAPVRAQSQQQMQTMADIRQLTEITQRLQLSVNVLAESVKDLKDQIRTVNIRLDAQATQISTAAATDKSLLDGLATTLAALENKVRDNKMDAQRLTEEMSAIRTGLGVLTDLITNLSQGQQPAAPAGAAAGDPASTAAAPMPESPSSLFQQGWGFYTKGDYPVARSAFEDYLKAYPTLTDAPKAQYWIGMSYLNEAGRTTDPKAKADAYQAALAAFTDVVTKYKACGCDAEPDASYERGLAYLALKQDQKAKEDFQKITAEYARTKSPAWENDNNLAVQQLKTIK